MAEIIADNIVTYFFFKSTSYVLIEFHHNFSLTKSQYHIRRQTSDKP